MRWPPVIFTIGTAYFSATSAMRRSSAARRHAAEDARDDGEGAVLLDVGVHAVVDEARVALVVVRPCPRSSRSSDASPALLAGSSCAAGEHARTPPRRCAGPRSRIGAHQLRASRAARRARSSAPTDPRAARRRPRAPAPAAPAACTRRIQVPARVASQSALSVPRPRAPRRRCAPFETPLQLQICADVRAGPADHRRALRRGDLEEQLARDSRAARRRDRRACSSIGAAPASPSRIAPPSGRRGRSASCRCRATARVGHDLVARARRLLLLAHHGEVDAHHLQLGRDARAS